MFLSVFVLTHWLLHGARWLASSSVGDCPRQFLAVCTGQATGVIVTMRAFDKTG